MGGSVRAGHAPGMTSAQLPAPSHVRRPAGDRPPGQQPPRPASAPVGPPLRRSSTDTIIGGVCGGLAEYSGIAPLLWRVGFVGLTVAGGAGIVVYLLLWVLMPSGPRRPEDRSRPLDPLFERLHVAVSGALARFDGTDR